MSEMFDIIVIGAGTAGMTAGIYAIRAGKSVLMLEQTAYGGQIINTPDIENYPGIAHVSGFEFAQGLYEQATGLGVQYRSEQVLSVTDGEIKRVKTSEAEYECKAIIIATGAKNRPLGLEREQELTGAGVSYCATCDGAFFRKKDVAVIGGGNTALEDGAFLSNYCNKVYIIHRRDEFRGDEKDVATLRDKENVEFVLDSVVTEILGEDMVEGIRVKNVKTDEVKDLSVRGLFIAIGQMPDNQAFADLVELDAQGYIKADESCETGTSGIYAAGDCRTKTVRQLTTAASDGAVAGLAAAKYRGISAFVITCLVAANLSVITPASAKKAPVIKLNCTKASVSVTHEKQLKLKKLSKKQKKNVRWSSSDESVATVSGKGLVQTWKPGKASIKAKYRNKTYTCKLTVTGPVDGKFYLPLTSSDATSDTTATWIYKDSWFTESSTIYERELARLSATLCWASTPARGKSDEEQSFYLRRCLTALGFEDFCVNDDYKKKPDKMTLGVAYALKTVKKGKKRYTLIAVVPRSSGYGSEWVSNMTLGYGPGDHEGFTRAKEILLEGLTKYLSDQSVKGDIKLWFAGHSRGAGTCALAEAYLADHPESLPDGVSLQREDIYGYNLSTIHAAAFSSQADRDHMQKDYPFIHNIELPYDIFKELIPSYYGFDRYGVTHGLYYTSDDEKDALKILEKTDPALYSTYSRHIPSEHGVAELMSAFVSTMTEKIPSRQVYVDEWQKKMDGVRDVPDLLPVFMPIFIGMNTAQADVYAATIQHYSQVMYCFLSIDLHGVA